MVLSDEQLNDIMKRLLKNINEGLSKDSHDSAAVKCFVTYVQDLPSGKGKFFHLSIVSIEQPLSCQFSARRLLPTDRSYNSLDFCRRILFSSPLRSHILHFLPFCWTTDSLTLIYFVVSFSATEVEWCRICVLQMVDGPQPVHIFANLFRTHVGDDVFPVNLFWS